MAKFCPNCGNEVNENAVICVKCGASLTPGAEEPVSEPVSEPVIETAVPAKKAGPSKSVIFGAIGLGLALFSIIVFGFGIFCHVFSVVGIVLGIKELKNTQNKTGLIVSIVGELLSVIKTIIFIVGMIAMFAMM